jgi:hypothetical protein
MTRLFAHRPDGIRRNFHHNSHSLFFALLAQLAGIVVTVGLVSVFPLLLFEHLWVVAVLQGICALLVAWRLRAPIWWLFIHLVFMPCIVLASRMALPSWVWFSGFSLLLLIFWRTDISQVPLYLTNRKSRDALLPLLPTTPCRMIDIGCGDGGVLRHLALARPDCMFVGFEHAPLTWAWAWLFARKFSNLSIRRGNFWDHSLATYDVVYAFLSPAPMAKLGAKAQAEMLPFACLVSNSFAIPEMTAQTVIDVTDQRQTRLYIYQNIPQVM